MDSKKINIMWSVSLIIIGVATIILAGASFLGIELPDIAARILGVLDLISLPVLAFSTVKKAQNKK
ncbi:MAG: hypothetical protein MSH60_11355 [Ruminococcus sp.]|nr:hypothetical protein [Ruminococcus sp.]